MSRSVHSCTHWLRPRNPPSPPPPALGIVYEVAIGQQRKTLSLCNPLQRIHNTTCILPDGLLLPCAEGSCVRTFLSVRTGAPKRWWTWSLWTSPPPPSQSSRSTMTTGSAHAGLPFSSLSLTGVSNILLCQAVLRIRITGSTCFLASRIHYSEVWILLSCKNSKKNLDSYYFVTLWLFIFEKWCKCTFKK